MKIFAILFLFTFQAKATQCVAHRGDNQFYLENSMASFQSAIDKEAHFIEFDVHHTADGVPLVLHDKDLKRVAEANSECPLDEKVENLLYHVIKEKCRLSNLEAVPLFDDVLRLISSSDSGVFIELKDSFRVNDLLLVQDHFSGRGEKVFFISFKEEYLEKVKNWLPLFKGLTGAKILQLKVRGWRATSNFDGVSTRLMGRRRVRRAQRKNQFVSVWTKTSKKSILKYINRGVDFITTNNPGLCVQLAEKL